MVITRKDVAEKIAGYLRHEFTLEQLVDWAETSLMTDSFEIEHVSTLSRVIGRLGVADVRDFGLTWEDCEDLLGKLGFATKVEIVARS
jgi:hypothetical protein